MNNLSKRTVILGASTNPARFSYKAAHMLSNHGHEIIPVGLKKGAVAGKQILDIRGKPFIEEVDTITLYMNSKNQRFYYDYILTLNPRRIIFNPGAENPELISLTREKNIHAEENCTLIMLNAGMY